ncbi:MAG: S1C family serine protease [Hyphomicrobiales bacterium]|nr:S1C family serine protease [Hyphomicrobiales bacterium]
MSDLSDWEIPPALQPNPEEYDYDLDATVASVVGIRALVPIDAFTAETLGTERAGNGVLIDGGVVLTVGYLAVEAETIWLTFSDGTAVEGHALGYDQVTGFALVQPLTRLDLPGLPLGNSSATTVGDNVVIAGIGGRECAVAAQIVAKQEFAGYWEYVLDEAIFATPAHPHWGGAAVIGPAGDLIGIGSLQLQAAAQDGEAVPLNMIVPIDILKPVLDDLLTKGRRNQPVRPWLGLYATGIDDTVVVFGLAEGGPAEAADVRAGDVILAVDGETVTDLAEFYRMVWDQGDAGVEVPLTLYREEDTLERTVVSSDRNLLLKGPRLH